MSTNKASVYSCRTSGNCPKSNNIIVADIGAGLNRLSADKSVHPVFVSLK